MIISDYIKSKTIRQFLGYSKDQFTSVQLDKFVLKCFSKALKSENS